MQVGFTQFYGAVLDAGQQRADLIANNIANADTPGFKARDVSFDDAVNASLDPTPDDGPAGDTALYRSQGTVALDGNDVSLDNERIEFVQNAERMQAGTLFLRQSTSDLITALRPNPSGA